MTATEARALLAVVTVIGAVGVTAAVAGIADHIAAAVLIVAGLGWVAVVVLRRERRIRARLADPRTRPAARPSAARLPAAGPPAAAPLTRVGPGDPTPVSPAPTTRPGTTRDVRPATAVAPTGGV